MRSCVNRTGPGEVSLIANAAAAITGANTISPATLAEISKARFQASVPRTDSRLRPLLSISVSRLRGAQFGNSDASDAFAVGRFKKGTPLTPWMMD